jgi:DNA-binding PadR family transcriptional regulator
MERLGWLQRVGSAASIGLKARQEYTITERGSGTLAVLRQNVAEMHRELQERPEQARERRKEPKAEAPVC